MSEYANLLYAVENEIGIITLNRSKELNALNSDTLLELERLLQQIESDEAVKTVIITGGGKAFVAGADIVEMQPLSAVQARTWVELGQRVFRAVEQLSRPVIAAVNGFALGGGCELALACDIRIASETAKFGQPEAGLGITPGFGGTQRLPRVIGTGRAKELLLTGAIIDATEAYRIGLVNMVAAPEVLLDAAKEMAQKINARAPVAVRLCKAAVNTGMEMDSASGIAFERDAFALCFSTFDQKEGMTAFIEKRKACFTGS